MQVEPEGGSSKWESFAFRASGLTVRRPVPYNEIVSAGAHHRAGVTQW
jgi:hypothetical protein